MAIFRATRSSAPVLTRPPVAARTSGDGLDSLQAAGGSGPPAGAGGNAAPATTTVAAASGSSAPRPSWKAAALALAYFVPGVVASAIWLGDSGGPTYAAAQGIGAFALFYVVAQAAERFVEMTMPLSEKAVSRAKGKPKSARVSDRDKAVVDAVMAVETAASDAGAQAGAAAARQAEVDQARVDRTLITFGATAALGMLLCGYLGADFLTSVGVDFTPGKATSPSPMARVVMMAVTGLIVGAGSKQLHDTISTISKSSDEKSTPSETGGKK